MNKEPMSARKAASEIEGDPIAALKYGMRSTDIAPGPLREAWADAEQVWDQLQPIIENVNELAEEALQEGDPRS